jgi:hypothetical protein
MFPLLTFTTKFSFFDVSMNNEGMIGPTKTTTRPLMLHKEIVWYVWIDINSEGGALVKCLPVLKIHLPHVKTNQLIIKWCATVLHSWCLQQQLQIHYKYIRVVLQQHELNATR